MPDNTAPVTCTLEFELATGVWTLSSPNLADRWCEACKAAYGLGPPPPPGRCTATRTEQVDHTPTVRRCTREDTPQAHEDGYHQWMRPGHAVRWLVRPGTDNATGLRTAIQTLEGLDDNGEPDLLARLQASLTRARKK